MYFSNEYFAKQYFSKGYFCEGYSTCFVWLNMLKSGNYIPVPFFSVFRQCFIFSSKLKLTSKLSETTPGYDGKTSSIPSPVSVLERVRSKKEEILREAKALTLPLGSKLPTEGVEADCLNSQTKLNKESY